MIQLGLNGKVAVVSASSRGVGRAIARALAAAGVGVTVNYLNNEDAARRTIDEIAGAGGRAIGVRADLSTEQGAADLIGETTDRLGAADILVNNVHGRIGRAPFPKSAWEDHARHVEGILKPAVILSRCVLPAMKLGGWGRIVNVGSHIVNDPVTGYSAYASAMASLIGFTRNLAWELGPSGITVNMVSPGFILTENTPHVTPAVLERMSADTPLGRLGVPEDVAGPILFLCSELGRFVTGANIAVDGGKAMGTP